MASGSDPAREDREANRSQSSLLIERKDLFEETSSVISGGPRVYKLVLHEEYAQGKYRKLQFGTENPLKQHKIIMLVGATGSGKTTLINALINYILGVKWEDNYRLILIKENTNRSQAHSQTSEVTAYQLNYIEAFTVPYNLTIIDTPGFDDTRGRDHDKEIPKQLKLCFDSPGSISHIDAIYFALQSSLARLTSTQEYIFGSMLSIFAKDIEKNIQICATFADAGKPMVLQALIESEVSCVKNKKGIPVYFKFNNCALYVKKSEEEEEDDDEEEKNDNSFLKGMWDIGKTESEKLLIDLEKMESKSLLLTKEVLKERQTLEDKLVQLQGITEKIALDNKELSKLNHNLKGIEQIIGMNKNYKGEEHKDVNKKIPIHGGVYNCERCEETCTRNGFLLQETWNVVKWGLSKKFCLCDHDKSAHRYQSFEWKKESVTIVNINEDMKKKYEEACKQEKVTKKEIENKEIETKKKQTERKELIEKVARVLRCLQKISLKPNPLTVTDYIDLLISKERQEGKPGFQERIASLVEFKSNLSK
ncbi:uncharacterized protein LOC108718452 [Xenopus laevis]|uniref:Septin-type G domain-containing protein n=2 Tax=Xenopus laevis TaxID=8355 RepID=A0A974CME1_XENLA|nr:uncharacterized protein LOC108718452 [Xenopus laevis]OCT75306.1 hypothetical protein XELAEV_18030484mg [Xenopus laevis]